MNVEEQRAEQRAQNEQGKRELTKVLFIFCAAISILALPQPLEKLIRQIGTLNWIKTEGTIVESSLDRAGSSNHPRYAPNIRFSYTVGEKEYQGSQISPWGGRFRYKSEAQAYIADYQAGTKTDLYYKPSAPEQSYLERGVTAEAVVMSGIFSIPLIIAVFLFPKLFQKRRVRRKAVIEC